MGGWAREQAASVLSMWSAQRGGGLRPSASSCPSSGPSWFERRSFRLIAPLHVRYHTGVEVLFALSLALSMTPASASGLRRRIDVVASGTHNVFGSHRTLSVICLSPPIPFLHHSPSEHRHAKSALPRWQGSWRSRTAMLGTIVSDGTALGGQSSEGSSVGGCLGTELVQHRAVEGPRPAGRCDRREIGALTHFFVSYLVFVPAAPGDVRLAQGSLPQVSPRAGEVQQGFRAALSAADESGFGAKVR